MEGIGSYRPLEPINMNPNVTVIFSRHHSEGICSSDALYQIIEKVKPEIIFEELSEDNFERAYNSNRLSTLEIWAIKMYLLSHPIKHIPVDTYPHPENFDDELDSMYDKLIDHAGEHSIHFKVSAPPSTSFNKPLPALGLSKKQTYEKSKSTTNGSRSSFFQIQWSYPAGILSA